MVRPRVRVLESTKRALGYWGFLPFAPTFEDYGTNGFPGAFRETWVSATACLPLVGRWTNWEPSLSGSCLW